MDFQQFYTGGVFDAYTYLGAHVEGNGVIFRTFAPNASRVCLIGEFNDWQEWDMTENTRAQFYERYVEGAKPGQMYKYVIYGQNGRVEHCDPYGFGMELRPAFASIVRDLHSYVFHDEKWMQQRTLLYDRPLNIYELHLGSWKRKVGQTPWYRYDEIADDLIAYVHAHHYTHVEFMPLAEYPFDGSWGYQVTGFFAPTSRYGTADQLKELVDRLHQASIGVILDFVPAHFAKDAYALRDYDGTPLYEYPDSDVSVSEWGSCNFIFSRREVACFVQSAANYWLSEYHFDGLRMDAVSRIIYWMGEEEKGVNEVAVAFLRRMNAGLRALHPTAMLIAEDSTSYEGTTKPAALGGLGFDYKWDLGWMNDTLDYFKKQSFERACVPERLTFSMYYFYRERYLLPLSHDEVVHGKKTIIDKIFGSYEMKFPQLRALYAYMYVHPGKKLNFMGNELAMFREWDEAREPDYFLLKYPTHDAFHRFAIALNALYETHPALYAKDYEPDGFAWIAMNAGGRNIYGITRDGGGETIRAFFNFSDEDAVYPCETDHDETLMPLLSTDETTYGGRTDPEAERPMAVRAGEAAMISLPAFSSVIFQVQRSDRER